MENKEFDFHKIETFADACMRLGISAESLHVDSLGDKEAFLQANAFYKLMIIQKAINDNKWRDKDGRSYYPYWELYSKENMESMSKEKKQILGVKPLSPCALTNSTGISGGSSAYVNNRCHYWVTTLSFPFCFNSEEAAFYAAQQFEDLFFQYYGIKVKNNCYEQTNPMPRQ